MSIRAPANCEGFIPQRFRPTFCKTCYKAKSDHPEPSTSDPVLRAAIPPPITSLANSQPIPALKKPAPSVPHPNDKRKSGFRKSLTHTNTLSRDIKSGFVAKQQQRGEIPNANKYFLNALRGMLSDGIGLNNKDTEDILNRVMGTNVIKEEPHGPQLLIDSKKFSYFSRFIDSSKRFLDEQQTLRKVITAQSQVRCYIVTKRFNRMSFESKEMMKRRNALYIELVKTERNFINATNNLISHYVVRMRQSDVIAPHECAFIFSNIETVAEQHTDLLKRLEAAADNWPFLGNIGKIFLDIKGLLNAISVYVSNFKNAMNEVERLSSENPRFKAFCSQRAMEDDLDITIGLTLPVNRIAQYEYLLRSIADQTPEGSEERADVENAFAVLAQSSIVVQKSLVQSGETARILSVQRTLRGAGPMALVKPGRILLDEFKFKKHLVIVFNDSIVLALPGKVRGKHKEAEPSKVKKASELKDCSITEGKSLELKMQDETFKLQAYSPETRQKFVETYHKALAELDRAKVFGVPLEDTVKRENSPDGIPYILKKNISFIEQHYLTQHGIFRVAGSKVETDLLRAAFDKGGEEAENIKLADKNVHSLCDIVKSYLRSFPEPILGYELYDPLVSLMKDQSNDTATQIAKIKEEVKKHTRPTSVVVLKYLFNFLVKVAENSEENKMTSSNLSIVFGPTCLWPRENSLESAMDMPYVNSVIQIIIENPTEILPN